MVTTKYGKVKGVKMDGYTVYKGIPYAKPPVGKLRFHAPVEPEIWEGIYEADDFKNRCMQESHLAPPYDKDFYCNPEYDRPSSEDCLYLHIWVPDNAQGKKLPVAFWIHGGAFLGGYGSEMEFDGAEYCKRDVILVTIEYRCNIFGFFAHPWLSEKNEHNISGNYGILDQVAALRWVYENIEAFGGDKDNITVFGQSAGAMSVQTLISTGLTKNMIARAIMQSGGSYGEGLHHHVTLEQQEGYGQILTEILGVNSLEELLETPAQEIAAAMEPLMGRVMPVSQGLFLVPTVDGVVLENDYYSLIDDNKIKDIPYMLGTTKNDITVTPEMVAAGEFSGLYRGCIAFSQKMEELGRKPSYVYYFTRDLPGDDFGAWHSCELWYMFGTFDRCWRPWEECDHKLKDAMLDYWVSFMRNGDPNKEGLPVWEPCTRENPVVFELK